MDQIDIYDITYALAAQGGREEALFGGCGPAARGAFRRSLAGATFPELWFEIPLAGDPWMDFHSLTSYGDVAGTHAAFAGYGGAYADALSWFAAQGPHKVRQLALSYDTGAGGVARPALSASVRFQPADWANPKRRGEIGHLAAWMQERGLADERCGMLAQTVFAKRMKCSGEFAVASCFPAFVKLRWRAGAAPDAKVYLLARVE